MCLADFTTKYSKKRNNVNRFENDDEDSENESNLRRKQAVLRHRRYNLDQDPANYYREQILLFLPFRNEAAEVEERNCPVRYAENIKTIEENRTQYSVYSDEQLEEAMAGVRNGLLNVEEEKIENFKKDAVSPEQVM